MARTCLLFVITAFIVNLLTLSIDFFGAESKGKMTSELLDGLFGFVFGDWTASSITNRFNGGAALARAMRSLVLGTMEA